MSNFEKISPITFYAITTISNLSFPHSDIQIKNKKDPAQFSNTAQTLKQKLA
jgi:hypothetical protein